MIKRLLFIAICFIFEDLIFANDTVKSMYPIKKRLEGPSVKYEVGFIDYDGNLIIPFEYSWGSMFENGMAAVEKKEQSYIINTKQEIIAEIEYPNYLRNGFSEGYCIISNIFDRYGYIDASGNIAIPIEYEYAEDFSGGIAKVMKNKEVFYIDKKGNKVKDNIMKSQEDEYFLLHNSINDLYGLKNKQGDILIPIEYKYLSLPNSFGLCSFTNMDTEPSYGIITVNNEILYPDGTFFELGPFKAGMAIFAPRHKYGGYLREDGKVFYFSDYY